MNYNPHEHKSDHDILVRIAGDITDIKREIEGNGRPGLRDRVTAIETRQDERDKTVFKASGLTAIGTVAVGAILEWLSKKGA